MIQSLWFNTLRSHRRSFTHCCCCCCLFLFFCWAVGVLRTQKSKYPLWRTREVKSSPFKAWSRSEHRPVCFSHCHEFLPVWPLHDFQFIRKKNPNHSLCFFLALGVANRILCGPAKSSRSTWSLSQMTDAGVLSAPDISIGCKTGVTVHHNGESYTCDLINCLVSFF